MPEVDAILFETVLLAMVLLLEESRRIPLWLFEAITFSITLEINSSFPSGPGHGEALDGNIICSHIEYVII